jgi:SAM-dependent methyltransferase
MKRSTVCELEWEDVFRDPRAASFVFAALSAFLEELGVPTAGVAGAANRIVSLASDSADETEYEAAVHDLLGRIGDAGHRIGALEARASQIFDQVSPHLLPGKTLDFGCGDGRIGERIHDESGVISLLDVYRHERIEHLATKGMKFIAAGQRGRLPIDDGAFDNLLVCTVYHHAEEPGYTLKETARITRRGGRVIVVESVHGAGDFDGLDCEKSLTADFTRLTVQNQFLANSFFDHLFNRCLFFSDTPSEKINVPYHYHGMNDWLGVFKAVGLRVVDMTPLGVDHRIAPLFHCLYVLERE